MPTVESELKAPLAASRCVERLGIGPISAPVAAFLWVTLAMALFAGLSAASRMAIDMGYHSLQVVFLRNFSALVLLLPLLAWRGLELARSRAIKLYGVRVLISLVSMSSWFCALAYIPLGEITAIGFLSPLFGTLAAIAFLGEKVRLRRWTALIVGFIGAMIILRPGLSSLGTGQIFALVSAVSGGLIGALLKHLTTEDDPDKIVFITTALMTPLSLIPALFVWRAPGLELLPVMLAVAVFGVLGHMTLMRAFRIADASLVMTFEFSRLPMVVAIGYWLFAEMIDIWTWVGAAVVFASAVYITHREAKLRKERAQATS